MMSEETDLKLAPACVLRSSYPKMKLPSWCSQRKPSPSASVPFPSRTSWAFSGLRISKPAKSGLSGRLTGESLGKALRTMESRKLQNVTDGSGSSSRKNIIPRCFLLELEQVFRRFDANGDGKISTAELEAILRALGNGTSNKEAALMVKAVDADGDGFIDLKEFIHLNTKATSGRNPGEIATSAELRDAFHVFDKNKTGFITQEELHRVLTNLGDQCTLHDCYEMIKRVDENGDGLVDFEEFKRM
eukprot:c35154_g1_i1 orf=84-821(+)